MRPELAGANANALVCACVCVCVDVAFMLALLPEKASRENSPGSVATGIPAFSGVGITSISVSVAGMCRTTGTNPGATLGEGLAWMKKRKGMGHRCVRMGVSV